MRHHILALTFLAALIAPAAQGGQPTATIPAGSKIYVEADKGFDVYLAAALQKKHVPVTIVDAREAADYVLTGSALHEEKGWASKIFLGHRDTSDATVKLIAVRDSTVLWAYAVHKKNSARGNQSTAEACAKHLKSIVR